MLNADSDRESGKEKTETVVWLVLENNQRLRNYDVRLVITNGIARSWK